MKNKRIAVIGLGGIANTHINVLQNTEGADLVAGVDCFQSKRELFAENHGLPAYENIHELLDREDLDGIIVATPPSQREEIIKSALQASVSVLSEKPLAHSEESARRIAEYAKLYTGGKLSVGYCHRFTGAAQCARKLIREGAIGDPVWMQIVFSGNMPAMKEHWMTDPVVSGGGAAMDNACHALDLFQFILGRITSSSVERRHSWEGRGEDSFAISAKSDQGALGVFLGSYLCSVPENKWEICGTEAVLSFDYDGGGATLVKTSSDKQREEIPVAAAGTRFPSQMLSWLDSMDGRQSDIATAEQALDIAVVLSEDKLLV